MARRKRRTKLCASYAVKLWDILARSYTTKNPNLACRRCTWFAKDYKGCRQEPIAIIYVCGNSRVNLNSWLLRTIVSRFSICLTEANQITILYLHCYMRLTYEKYCRAEQSARLWFRRTTFHIAIRLKLRYVPNYFAPGIIGLGSLASKYIQR